MWLKLSGSIDAVVLFIIVAHDYGESEIAPRKYEPTGAALYDNATGGWFMWATELDGGCGMHTWTTNSHTIRAWSPTATGLYDAIQCLRQLFESSKSNYH